MNIVEPFLYDDQPAHILFGLIIVALTIVWKIFKDKNIYTKNYKG
ncbi:MAG: hypothetical protein ABJB11_16780 [Ferruginibacter sp.]